MKSKLLSFLGPALTHPRRVSTLLPTGSALAMVLTRQCQLPGKEKILELGTGNGAVTQFLDGHRDEDAQLYGLEIEHSYVEFMKENFPKVSVIEDRAGNLQKHFADNSLDCVVSTLPLTLMEKADIENIIKAVHAVLAPGAPFVGFQSFHRKGTSQSRMFTKFIKRHFSKFQWVDKVYLNIPPGRVFRAIK